jgi:hypothetical protein
MIFALLFWDILFADIPGAFETPHQTAPLDLAEETFYHARKELIDKRLEEVRQGQTREILEKHDDAHREKNTWCVGVQWDICTKQDLVEIVEVGRPSSGPVIWTLTSLERSALEANRSPSSAGCFAKIMLGEVAAYLISLYGTQSWARSRSWRSRDQATDLKRIKRFFFCLQANIVPC